MEYIKDKFITIDKKYINILTREELSIFVITQLFSNKSDVSRFQLKDIYNFLNISNTNTKTKDTIKNILKSLKNKEVLFFGKDFNCEKELNLDLVTNRNSDIYCELFYEIGENFCILYINDLLKIFSYISKNNIDRYSFIYLYCFILSYINYNKENEYYKLAFPSLSTIEEETTLSKNTILKYIDIYKSINILSCEYIGYNKKNNSNTKMYYCRKCDEELLYKMLNSQNTNNIVSDKKVLMNKKRSIKQRINNLELKITRNAKNDSKDIDLLKKLKEEYEVLGGKNV